MTTKTTITKKKTEKPEEKVVVKAEPEVSKVATEVKAPFVDAAQKIIDDLDAADISEEITRNIINEQDRGINRGCGRKTFPRDLLDDLRRAVCFDRK